MKILAAYDIVNDRIRVRVVNYLIKHGFVRVQNSVFLGNYTKKHEKILEKAAQFIDEESDKFYFFIICEEDYNDSIYITKNRNRNLLDETLICF